jgi:hypothetical protein
VDSGESWEVKRELHGQKLCSDEQAFGSAWNELVEVRAITIEESSRPLPFLIRKLERNFLMATKVSNIGNGIA